MNGLGGIMLVYDAPRCIASSNVLDLESRPTQLVFYTLRQLFNSPMLHSYRVVNDRDVNFVYIGQRPEDVFCVGHTRRTVHVPDEECGGPMTRCRGQRWTVFVVDGGL